MRLKSFVLVFLAFTFAGLLNFSIVETSWLAEENVRAAKYPFVWEMTGVYTLLLLVPLLVLVATRYPVRRGKVASRLLLHAAVFVFYAVSHTLLMWGSRELIYHLLGWGTYDYGDMRYRFFMEGQKQFIVYLGIYFLIRFINYARANRERDANAARLERELTEARLAALKMQLQPHFLFNALHMISSHIEDDPKVAGAMVQHLSSFLRATLRSSAAQEVPLREEMDFLASYVEIMKARFEERLSVVVSMTAETGDTLVPISFCSPWSRTRSRTRCATTPGGRRSASWHCATATACASLSRITVPGSSTGLLLPVKGSGCRTPWPGCSTSTVRGSGSIL